MGNAELIAEARGIDFEWVLDNSPEDSVETIQELAVALEAAEKRAEQAEAELRDVWRTDIPSLKDQRDAALAVIEKVQEHSQAVTSASANVQKLWAIQEALAAAPADALREVKAEAWDEGHHAGLRQADYEYGAAGFQVVRPNPYRREEQGRG